LTSNGAGALPTFQAASGGVTTISFGSTGLTPSTATSGAVSVAGTLAIANGGTGSTSTTYCSLTANVTGTLPVGNGGTGATTFTTNSVVLGNGTSALNANLVAPGASGNVLTSNGSTWTSAAAGGGALQTELFTSPGTWTKPSSCTQVRVTVIGGGGGGSTDGVGGASAGSTSSFGPAVSATGGPGAPGNNVPGTSGSGTVSVGTALKTGEISTGFNQAQSSAFFGVITGTAIRSPQPAASKAAIAYSTSSTFVAGARGAGAPATTQNGGAAGYAIAMGPVSAPVTVTVGAGGSAAGPTGPSCSGGVGGAVLVEFVG